MKFEAYSYPYTFIKQLFRELVYFNQRNTVLMINIRGKFHHLHAPFTLFKKIIKHKALSPSPTLLFITVNRGTYVQILNSIHHSWLKQAPSSYSTQPHKKNTTTPSNTMITSPKSSYTQKQANPIAPSTQLRVHHHQKLIIPQSNHPTEKELRSRSSKLQSNNSNSVK